MTERTLDELLFHMPAVKERGGNTWVRGFAASIIKQSRRRNWRPSEKQLSVMRRLVSDLFTERPVPTDEDGEITLIEVE